MNTEDAERIARAAKRYLFALDRWDEVRKLAGERAQIARKSARYFEMETALTNLRRAVKRSEPLPNQLSLLAER